MFKIIFLVIPNPANDWSNKDTYSDMLDGLAALVEKNNDPNSIKLQITRIIQPLVIPLIEKINFLKGIF
jgi:hypothetical protein